ncbi:MAG: hypothetical protein KKA05_02225 [Alphaproteobacteria bacterium]|nr:hypothetical protein [Alphaproteobacteria bacterium]
MKTFVKELLSVFFILLLSYNSAQAADEASLVKFPAEILYEGKMIDPKCVYDASDTREGESKAVDLNKCAEITVNGFSSPLDELVQEADGSYGYRFVSGSGNTGEFYYRYVGTIAEGLVLHLYYSMGGTGRFSDLGIYSRDDDTLREVRHITGGDRCWGGIRHAEVQDGHLIYSYNVTLPQLYGHYLPDTPYRNDIGGGFTECSAVVDMRDDKVEKVELSDRAFLPTCFKQEYEKQIALNKEMSDEEARNFIQKFSEVCPKK